VNSEFFREVVENYALLEERSTQLLIHIC